MKSLYEFYMKLHDLLTFPDNLKEKPLSFFVISPDEPKRVIKLKYQGIMIDSEGTVIQLKVVEEDKEFRKL